MDSLKSCQVTEELDENVHPPPQKKKTKQNRKLMTIANTENCQVRKCSLKLRKWENYGSTQGCVIYVLRELIAILHCSFFIK